MNTAFKTILSLTLISCLNSACVPKKFDIGIPKDIKLDLNANTQSQLKLAAEDLLNGNPKKAAESLADYSFQEVGNAILKSDAITVLSKAVETKEKVECYSDTKDYLKIEKSEENRYDFRLSLICFNPANLPTTEGASELDQLSIMVSSAYAFVEGSISWSKDGLIVKSKNENGSPDVSIKPMPLLLLKSARSNLVRIVGAK